MSRVLPAVTWYYTTIEIILLLIFQFLNVDPFDHHYVPFGFPLRNLHVAALRVKGPDNQGRQTDIAARKGPIPQGDEIREIRQPTKKNWSLGLGAYEWRSGGR